MQYFALAPFFISEREIDLELFFILVLLFDDHHNLLN